MKFKHVSSAVASAVLVSVSGVSMVTASFTMPNQPSVQAQSGRAVQTTRGCFVDLPFNASIAFNPTNIRREPSTSAQVMGQFRSVGESVRFDGINTGTAVPDAWDGQMDNMWYRLPHGRGVVAGAVVKGYPSRSTGCTSPSGLYTHPLNGTGSVSQGAGGSKSHNGRSVNAIDFAVPLGTPVYAMRAGTVVQVQDSFPTWGRDDASLGSKANWVVIGHGDGTFAAYLHFQQGSAQKAGVKVGNKVNQRQLIGYVGSSGWSTGPHLHVEVQRGLWGQTIPLTVSR